MKYILNYTLIIIASLILAISIYQDNDIKEKLHKGRKITNAEFRKSIAMLIESDEISNPKGG